MKARKALDLALKYYTKQKRPPGELFYLKQFSVTVIKLFLLVTCALDDYAAMVICNETFKSVYYESQEISRPCP
jgi:hypothetical protein